MTTAIGINLKAARARSGLTSEQLALRAGLSSRTIQDIENGKVKRPSAVTAGRIAPVLGIPVESLLTAALIPSGIGAANHDRADTIRSAQPTTPALQTPVESRP